MEYKQNDILVPDGYEGIYYSIGDGAYKKHHDNVGGIATFGEKQYNKLGNLTKDFLLKYLDNSIKRLDRYVADILNEGLKKFEDIEDIVLGIIEDVMFFAKHINKTFFDNFVKHNAFIDERWFGCLQFRSWRLGMLNHLEEITPEDFCENVLENIMYLACKLKEHIEQKCKGDMIKLF